MPIPASPPPRSPASHQTCVPRWHPPLQVGQLQRLSEALNKWSPLAPDEIFDDLNRAHAAHAGTAPVELADVAERLQNTLTYLVKVGRATPSRQLTAETVHALECAGAILRRGSVHSEPSRLQRLLKHTERTKPRAQLGRVRQLAWLTGELLQEMSAAGLIKDES